MRKMRVLISCFAILIVCTLSAIVFWPARNTNREVISAPIVESSEVKYTPAFSVAISSSEKPMTPKKADLVIVAPKSIQPVAVIATTSQPKKADPTPPRIYSVDEVYERWNPYIVSIRCSLMMKDGRIAYGGGTGILINHREDGPSIMMARHGFQYWEKGIWGSTSESCDVTFPDNGLSFTIQNRDFRIDSGDIDLGHLVLSGLYPYPHIKELLSDTAGLRSCPEVSSSTPVMIIGFPNDTPTTKSSHVPGEVVGFINGYKGGEYIITTAIARAGYSGGTTLSMRDNCYIGFNTGSPGADPTESWTLHVSLDGSLKY